CSCLHALPTRRSSDLGARPPDIDQGTAVADVARTSREGDASLLQACTCSALDHDVPRNRCGTWVAEQVTYRTAQSHALAACTPLGEKSRDVVGGKGVLRQRDAWNGGARVS